MCLDQALLEQISAGVHIHVASASLNQKSTRNRNHIVGRTAAAATEESRNREADEKRKTTMTKRAKSNMPLKARQSATTLWTKSGVVEMPVAVVKSILMPKSTQAGHFRFVSAGRRTIVYRRANHMILWCMNNDMLQSTAPSEAQQHRQLRT